MYDRLMTQIDDFEKDLITMKNLEPILRIFGGRLLYAFQVLAITTPTSYFLWRRIEERYARAVSTTCIPNQCSLYSRIKITRA